MSDDEAEDSLGCFVQNIATAKAKDIVDETFDSSLEEKDNIEDGSDINLTKDGRVSKRKRTDYARRAKD